MLSSASTGPEAFLTGNWLRVYIIIAIGMPALVVLLPSWFHVLLPLMIAVHAIAPVAANIPNNRVFGPVITRFQTTRKEVWLTIDDGPHPEDTPQFLDLLERYNARATFLGIGRKVESHAAVARSVVARGHEMGNHTHSHPINCFSCYLPWQVAREMDGCTKAILNATGVGPRWFRSPLGLANCFVHFAVRKRGLRLLGWSARGYDGVSLCPERIVGRILCNVRPGTVILLHEGRRDASGRAINVMVLERLLGRLAERGYACIIPSPDQLG